jgi:hypothetical protein
MLSSPGALLLPRYLRHKSYVDLSNVFDMDACMSPRFSSTNLLRSCHGYCLLRIHILVCGLVGGDMLVWLVG